MMKWYPAPVDIDPKYINKICINGMNGRHIVLPANDKKKEKHKIVVLGGQHSSAERLKGVLQFLQDYGQVNFIDLPGFGGMDSFYTIGKKPDIDNYANYLYSVFKVLKLNKNINIFSISLSFQFLTRMFQLHPDSQDWIKKIIGLGIFADSTDFNIPPGKKNFIKVVANVGKTRPGAKLVDIIFVKTPLFKITARLFAGIANKTKKERLAEAEMERHLWHVNDRKTHAQTALDMFKRNLTSTSDKQITSVDIHNIIADQDQYFDNDKVHQSMDKLYKKYTTHKLKSTRHAPDISDGVEAVRAMIPKSAEKLL